MERCSLALSGSWTAKELADCLNALDEIYLVFLIAEAVESLREERSGTKDVVNEITLNARISDLSNILRTGSIPQNAAKSTELVPSKKLEIEKADYDDSKKRGSLILRGSRKAIEGLKWALQMLTRIAEAMAEGEEQKAKQAKIETIGKIDEILAKAGVPEERRQQIALESLVEQRVVSEKIKNGKISVEESGKERPR